MIPILLLMLLATQVFAGDNAGARIRVHPLGYVGVGPGQEITVTVEGEYLVGVQEWDLHVGLDPPEAFDRESVALDLAAGTSVDVRVLDSIIEWEAAAPVAHTGSGCLLGKLTLNTSAGYEPGAGAAVDITRVSVGPSSTDRDEFGGDHLWAAVVQINRPVVGDANGDLKITVADALRTLRMAVGGISICNTAEIPGCPDRTATVGDALRLLRYAVGVPEVLVPWVPTILLRNHAPRPLAPVDGRQ